MPAWKLQKEALEVQAGSEPVVFLAFCGLKIVS
jgi:hypothetical protein